MNRLLSIFVVGLLLALFVNQSHAHMWLRVPISRGGVGFSGNTNGPCANKPWGSGEITTFQAGQNVTFQFRVNQHGPGPFMFALSRGNEKYTEVLRSGIPNQVTAGPEGFNGVNINIVLPKKTCNNCTIQLSGMSKSDGTKTWYNCADIKIVSSSSLPKVTKLNPVSGPTKGGNKINVIGTGFGSTKNENVKCRFDNVEIDGTWVDKAKISCVVPPRNAPSTAAVEVSLDDGETYSSSGVVYTYLGAPIVPVISSIKPTTVKPGATITITGKYFYASEMVCKFTAGQSSLYVGAQATSETTAVCTVPTGLKGAVSLEVNVDGSDYSDSGSSIQIKTGDEETQESQSAGGKVSPANLVISMGLVFLVALFPSY